MQAVVLRLEEDKRQLQKQVEEWKAKSKELETAWEISSSNEEKLQKQLDELKSKDVPKKVECHIKLPKDRIAGYCPTCDGTVDIELTCLVKLKGHRCSWCGQAIDLTGVEYPFE